MKKLWIAVTALVIAISSVCLGMYDLISPLPCLIATWGALALFLTILWKIARHKDGDEPETEYDVIVEMEVDGRTTISYLPREKKETGPPPSYRSIRKRQRAMKKTA